MLSVLVLAALLAPVVVAYTPLSDASLRHIPAAGADLDIHNAAGLLAPLLIPRVPDTPGSDAARAHFLAFFAAHLPAWTVELHNTTATTPATGDRQVAFRNIILRRDPPGAAPGDVSRLTLAAHYDTLYRPEGFIGATDSAASCAMLMHVARSVDAALTARWEGEGKGDDDDDGLEGLPEGKGVQILLLDGEEAWVSWTGDDNTYGSRALAADWEERVHPPGSAFRNDIETVGLFVLLDLLGAPAPRIPSYFESTHWAYQGLAKIEERMRALGLLESSSPSGAGAGAGAKKTRFLPEAEKPVSRFGHGYISDDHVPFMRRGVDVLHLIPTPFPWFWHKMEDDAEHLDGPVMQDWAKLITAFVAEWMDLEGHMPSSPPASAEGEAAAAAADPYEKTEL